MAMKALVKWIKIDTHSASFCRCISYCNFLHIEMYQTAW